MPTFIASVGVLFLSNLLFVLKLLAEAYLECSASVGEVDDINGIELYDNFLGCVARYACRFHKFFNGYHLVFFEVTYKRALGFGKGELCPFLRLFFAPCTHHEVGRNDIFIFHSA